MKWLIKGKNEKETKAYLGKDTFGSELTIQESSSHRNHIWLRTNERVHITRNNAKEIADVLLKFHYTGQLFGARVHESMPY